MSGWWLHELWQRDHVLAVSWVFWVIFSICLHELGHGWAAIRRGDMTPYLTGHMTWNPLVHMGPMSLIIFLLTGMAWGAMPVDPTRLRGRYADSLVALAGPIVNLSLWLVCLVLLCGWMLLTVRYVPNLVPPRVAQNVETFLNVGTMLNIVLCLFNLMPIPPLDGSRILANVFRPFGRLFFNEQFQILSLILLVVAIRYGGRVILPVARDLTNRSAMFLYGLFP